MHAEDSAMDDMFPTVDTTNEDGMLSPDHAMSLPSPTLSPITGAINPAHEEFFNDSSPVQHALVHRSPTPLEDDDPYTVQGMLNTYPAYPPIMQIPAMCETFDVLPSNVQTYVLWQLLRRCQIPTLQFAAQVIAPTLQRDFLADLPLELSLNILKYLDSKSLCRAGAVSRMWHKIVDADDYIWKHRFEQDGFKLSEEDMEKNQDQDQLDELYPSTSARRTSRTSISSASGKTIASPRRSARHASTSSTTPIRAGKRPSITLKSPKSTRPKPTPPKPTFKDLYRQHFVVRSNWMNPHVRPRHISFQGHGRNVVTCLQFDSDRVISGSDDSTINIYETRTGRLAHTLHGHDGGVWALQYLDNVLVSGSTDRTVRVWDIEKAECTQIFYGHTSTVRCLQIIMPRLLKDGTTFPEEPLIVTGSRDSTLRVWALPKRGSPRYLPSTPPETAAEDGAADPTSPGSTSSAPSINPYFLRKLTGHSQSVRALSGAGNTLVSGSYDHTVRVWKIETGECRWRLQGHTAKVYSVVYDAEQDRCFSGSMDHCVKVWDLVRGTCLHTLEGNLPKKSVFRD
jgi:F-box and WD-40 domain protein CDC4